MTTTQMVLLGALALGVAFIGFGFTIPDYVRRANELRATCEQMLGMRGHPECVAMESRAIREGEAKANPQPVQTVAPGHRPTTPEEERRAEEAAQRAIRNADEAAPAPKSERKPKREERRRSEQAERATRSADEAARQALDAVRRAEQAIAEAEAAARR